ncbi:DUF397 domain-containing protein [Streptomyces sp. NBC_00006]|uniref:DUF397 domain-containing protein n=1 Tax=unclassified Streptomyces TaxID=2593676 RepID=UPI0022522DE7|nr:MULTISPECIES: DUF397 domain-containing protein [unclassified Streptomyces]MCX4832700.1 DUF397 domain-containing protein [Streptomyces sp. NBC_01016]MCX5533691.1 DUF397 domain-containing protein [Streptomyces sp. NBC_00006]
MSTGTTDSIPFGIALEKEKARLYALDISEAQWLSAPGGPTRGGPVEIAALGDGAVALRNPADPRGLVLRFTAHEWEAFKLGALHGEFD